jgi:hypothetical protein
MKPAKESCLAMAQYHFNCRHERLMWQWLFTWASWDDGPEFFAEPTKPVSERRKPRRKWKNLTKPDTDAIIRQMPNWSMDHLSTHIFKMLIEDKLKEKNT